MAETEPKRGLLSGWELFFLLIAGLILLYFVLQLFGLSPVEVTEESEFIERPHQ